MYIFASKVSVVTVHDVLADPTLMYSTAGEETSGLESSFTSPSVHKDMVEQYLNKMGTSGAGGAGLGDGGLTSAGTDPLANLYSHAGLASTLAGTNHLPISTTSAAAAAGLLGRAGAGLLTSAGMPTSLLPTASAYGLPNLPISTSAASNLLLDDLVDTGKVLFLNLPF